MREPTQTFLQVLDTLDHLRFIPELRYHDGTPQPTGMGCAPLIVMLPDLLVDLERTAILPDNPQPPYTAPGRKPVCTPGGRATQAACSLWHLLSPRTELFECHLLAKTGTTGLQVLEEEFNDTKAEPIIRAKYLPNLKVEWNTNTRFAWCNNDQPESTIEPNKDNELSVIDFVSAPISTDNSRIDVSSKDKIENIGSSTITRDILGRAHVIYFSSIKDSRSLKLLQFTRNAADKSSMFIDLMRMNPEMLEELLDFVYSENANNRKTHISEHRPIAGFFVPSNNDNITATIQEWVDTTTENKTKHPHHSPGNKKTTEENSQSSHQSRQNAKTWKSLAQKLDTVCFVQSIDNNRTIWTAYMPDYSYVSESKLIKKGKSQDERFKSGVILAYSTWHVLNLLEQDDNYHNIQIHSINDPLCLIDEQSRWNTNNLQDWVPIALDVGKVLASWSPEPQQASDAHENRIYPSLMDLLKTSHNILEKWPDRLGESRAIHFVGKRSEWGCDNCISLPHSANRNSGLRTQLQLAGFVTEYKLDKAKDKHKTPDSQIGFSDFTDTPKIDTIDSNFYNLWPKPDFSCQVPCRDSTTCPYGTEMDRTSQDKPDTQNSAQAQVDDHYAAILIDLDSTLLDSTRAREAALRPAMEVLWDFLKKHCFCNDMSNSKNNATPFDLNPLGLANLSECSKDKIIDAMVNFFHENIYRNWPLYQKLRMGDFRQEWNHPGWYAVFLMFFSKELNCMTGLKTWIDKHPKAKADELKKYWEAGGFGDTADKWPAWARTLKREYTVSRYADVIEKARHAFSNSPLSPYREAHDFLFSLKCSKYFRPYIVSEGNHAIQMMKLERTGLLQYFEPGCILTTSAAADAKTELSELDQAEKRLKNLQKKHKSKVEGYKNSLYQLHDCQIHVKDISTTNNLWQDNYDQWAESKRNELIKNITTCSNKLRQHALNLEVIRKVRAIIRKMASKGGVSFYAAAIASILRNPDNPLSHLTSFHSLLNAPRELPDDDKYAGRLKFAVIGDKPSGDIQPLNQLLGKHRLLSIRILAGNYLKDEPPSQLTGDSVSDYSVETLSQAKFLLASKPWSQIHCTYNSDVFFHDVVFNSKAPRNGRDEVNLEHIVLGLEMTKYPEYAVVRKVCATVLGESFCRRDATQCANLMDACLKLFIPDNGDTREFELARRVILVVSAISLNGHLRQLSTLGIVANWLKRMYESIESLQINLNTHKKKAGEAIREYARAFNILRIRMDDFDDNSKEIIKNAMNDMSKRMLEDPQLRDLIGDIIR